MVLISYLLCKSDLMGKNNMIVFIAFLLLTMIVILHNLQKYTSARELQILYNISIFEAL